MSKRTFFFRTGEINAAGGKPIVEATKTYRCVTAARFGNNTTAGEAGIHVSFGLGHYNTPLSFVNEVGTLVATGLSMDRHPSGHVQILQDQFNRALVIKSHFRIETVWHGADTDALDYVVAYKFSSSGAVTEPAFVDSVATTEVWLDMQATRGWVWKRYTANHNVNGWPSRGVININIPDVIPLTYKLLSASTVDIERNDMQSTIADTTGSPTVEAFLHLCIFKLQSNSIPGVWAATNQVVVDIRCTQTVRLSKVQGSAQMIDEGDVV